MLLSAPNLLISILFSLLLLGSHGEEGLEVNTTQNIAEALRTMANEYVSLESEANLKSNKDRETSTPKASNFSLGDAFNKSRETTDIINNLPTDNFSRGPTPTSMVSESPPLSPNFASNLPQNSSVADGIPLSVSTPPNTTSAVSSEKFTWSSANDTVTTPDNNPLTVSILPSAPTTTSVNPMTTEPDDRLTTTSDNMVGFTVYEETTLRSTIKFTNNSKIFPNTSDPQDGKYKQINCVLCEIVSKKSIHITSKECTTPGKGRRLQ